MTATETAFDGRVHDLLLDQIARGFLAIREHVGRSTCTWSFVEGAPLDRPAPTRSPSADHDAESDAMKA
jgi:hypothetical protein